MADDVKLVRGIGVVGQGGAGKTSLADALVFAAGGATRIGRVDDGSSLFDFEPEEVRRKTTLTTAVCSVTWKKYDVTVLDMPGYANFLPDALACLRACTGVVFTLVPGADELRVEAEKLWTRAEDLKLPVIAFVSRMDRERANFEAAVSDMQKILGAKPVMIQYPIGAADSFRGVVDLVSMRALMGQPDGSLKESDLPPDVMDEAQAAREQMIELAAEANDTLTERYLENGTLTNDEIVEALREGTVGRRFTPVLCGSAAKAIGMQPALDAAVAYLGSAADMGVLSGIDAKIKEPIERLPEVGEPFSALVFKTMVDPFAGKLSIFRVLSGKVTADSTVLNVNKDGKERLGHLFKLTGKKQVQVTHAIPGEIIAVAKLKDTATGDSLADEKAPILYPGFTLPPPAISFAVEPKSKGDEEKATQALMRMMEEDP